MSFSRLSFAETIESLSANGMRLGVEDHLVEIQSLWPSEEQIEIFESLREEKALHRVRLFFRHDALQRSVALVRAAILNEVFEHGLPHPHVLWVSGVVIKIIS